MFKIIARTGLAGLALAVLATPAMAVRVTGTPAVVCLEKTVTPSTPLSEGDPAFGIIYSVTIQNIGNATATGVKIIDDLPSDVVFDSADTNCTHDGSPTDGTVICVIGDLLANQQASRSIVVDIPSPVLGQIINDSYATMDPNGTQDGDASVVVCSAVLDVDPEVDTPGGGCRVTGGLVDESGEWVANTWIEGAHNTNRYTAGGQAGANTALPLQPKGEWTHHQQKGAQGRFVFHAGTASAPPETVIAEIVCSDPGFCNPAREAPDKQIDFNGIGQFKNIEGNAPVKGLGAIAGVTLHYFEVNIDDLGEPGRGAVPAQCSPDGYEPDEIALCDCPDFYRITIHADSDPTSAVIYTVEGYIKGGNLQIHPLTGFDQ